MTNTATAKVATAKASSFLQQLCKHFAHKLDTEYDPEQGWIQFDFGKADLLAHPDGLIMTANAENPEDLARLQRVLALHLERFAFREDLIFEWRP